jgi:DNA-binding NarL/FixJ family response regulator
VSPEQQARPEPEPPDGEAPAEARRVVLVEDHEVLRQGLALLLERQGYEVVGQVDTAEEAYDLIVRERPDVAIVDIKLPGQSGIELARRLMRAGIGPAVLLYTGVEDHVLLRDALDCGARGFVVKTTLPERFLAAVHAVAAGGSYVDPAVTATLLSRSVTDHVPLLSVREREVLDLLARGRTGEEAADSLHLSSETVRTHVRNAMRKLEAHTRTHAIVLALRSEQIQL